MEWFSKGMLFTHILAGALSLLLFWLPVFTKKGGKAHRKIGNIYVWLMWVVVITAFLMCIEKTIDREYVGALFLGFLSLVTGKPLWLGMAMLNNKKQYSHRFRQIYISISLLILVYSFVLLGAAIYYYPSPIAIMMLFFGMLGFLGERGLYQEWKNGFKSRDWLREHYANLLISGAAAYTAFFAFGGRSIFGDAIMSGYWSLVPWLGPTITIIIVIHFYDRFYKKGRFEKK